jgi:hypothetical protein
MVKIIIKCIFVLSVDLSLALKQLVIRAFNINII